MHLSIIEWQMLASTIFFLPVVIVLTVALLRGAFKDAETVKYIVVDHHEEDYWDTRGRDERPLVEPD